MQFQTPQFIDLQDRIIGPITLIQLIYLLVGGIIVYIIYQILGSNVFLFIIVGGPIALFTLALAFLKIQDQPLTHFVKAGIIFYNSPKVRLWHRQGYQPTKVSQEVKKPKETETLAQVKHRVDKSELQKLAQMVDTRTVKNAKGEKDENFGRVTQVYEKLLKTYYAQHPEEREKNSV